MYILWIAVLAEELAFFLVEFVLRVLELQIVIIMGYEFVSIHIEEVLELELSDFAEHLSHYRTHCIIFILEDGLKAASSPLKLMLLFQAKNILILLKEYLCEAFVMMIIEFLCHHVHGFEQIHQQTCILFLI